MPTSVPTWDEFIQRTNDIAESVNLAHSMITAQGVRIEELQAALANHTHGVPTPEPTPPEPPAGVVLKNIEPFTWVLSTDSQLLNSVYGVQTGDTEVGVDGNVGVSDNANGPAGRSEILFTMDPWDAPHISTSSDRSEFLLYFPREQGQLIRYDWTWNFRGAPVPEAGRYGCINMQWHAGNNHTPPQANGPVYAIGRYLAFEAGGQPMLSMWRKQSSGGDRLLYQEPWPVGETVNYTFDIVWSTVDVAPPVLRRNGSIVDFKEDPRFSTNGTIIDPNLPSWKFGIYGSVAAPFEIGIDNAKASLLQ